MRAVNNHLVQEHYNHIANTMKYYFIGIDVFHNELLTPFQFVEQKMKSDLPIQMSDLFVLTEKSRKQYVLDFQQIKQLLDGTLKFEGNVFFNENNILLSVKFNEATDEHTERSYSKNHPYGQGEMVYSKFFTSIGQLMKHVKSLSLNTVKEMYIIPIEAASVRLDKIYSDLFINFLEQNRIKITPSTESVNV